MPTTTTRPVIDPTTAIAEAAGRRALEEGRTLRAVAEQLCYRELFDRYLAGKDAPGERDQIWRRELFEVLLRQTKDMVREVVRRAEGSAAHATIAPGDVRPASEPAGSGRI